MSPRRPIFMTSCLRITCMWLPPHHVGQERHLPGALYGYGSLALVLGAELRDPTRPNLAAVARELAQHVVVLVVNVRYVLFAEHARLALNRPLPARSGAPSPTHRLSPLPN